ncbi:DUF6622 family protein [Dokdonella sp.]|uniref:DUF6622 family protein n=1 Tax=Dokdonella sp. TaxID=2291710 RepID=UPI001B197CFB|nr:DUF6622 family protein [Dokdonella sp.]MBO9661518.1 hypothetical protein [Dokdonella sp.]
MLVDILRGTPIWVYVLFAYLLWMGAWRLRPRVRNVQSTWIAPLLFIAWGLSGLAGREGSLSSTLACWIVGATVGIAIGHRIEPAPSVDRATGTILQPGSLIPLLRNLAIFGAHYLLHVAAVISPGAASRLLSWDVVVSGLSAGYFVSWGLLFARAWRDAPARTIAG